MEDKLTRLLADYKPTDETISLVRQTPILFLVGPTGAGKDSLQDRLIQSNKYHHIVSHTTRQPRINHGVVEQDGVEYHFIDLLAAQQMLEEKSFVEAKMYSGNVYGTSVAEIQKAHDEGKVAVTDLEVQGIAEYKAIDQRVMAVFLVPPDFATWQARLQRRYGDVVDVADMRLRLQTALKEIDQLLTTDYYFAVVNDQIDTCLTEIEAIADSRQHDPDQEELARDVAQKLAADIEAHLATDLQP
jgi:guanylate kinase